MTHAEVLVVGAGPAGIAAATTAAEHGRKVILLDENPALGGQIWRSGVPGANGKRPSESAKKRQALARLHRSGVQILSAHRVFDADPSGSICALREGTAHLEARRFSFDCLILATGARERFLPFPGWTLPGVFGAGGLQALVQGGLPVKGRRIVVAGTGPLLFAVAAHLKERGADIQCVAEQAPSSQLFRFLLSLGKHPGKLLQGIAYRTALWKTSFRTGCWPVNVLPNEEKIALRAVVLSNGSRTWEEPCDLLACGFHLVPNTELAVLLGCAMQDSFVSVDSRQRTSLPNVYCVGEPTGIAGLEAALLEGKLAGLACARQPTKSLERQVAAEHSFATTLERTFDLRAELRSLATEETILCRCEDVPLGKVSGYSNWREAKLQTRCGMGPCQGRICGPITHTLFGWRPESVRQPIFPVPLDALCLSSNTPKSTEEKP
jgi:NADPH-dependent 2,4-dienoyl-CoA reductase/sulfur reductase-like enzyme